MAVERIVGKNKSILNEWRYYVKWIGLDESVEYYRTSNLAYNTNKTFFFRFHNSYVTEKEMVEFELNQLIDFERLLVGTPRPQSYECKNVFPDVGVNAIMMLYNYFLVTSSPRAPCPSPATPQEDTEY